MAVSTTSYFSNAIQGIPQLGSEFSIYDKDATPKFALGTRFTRQDGNVYVYSHFGADVNRGILVSTDASESSVVDTDNIVIAPASAANTNDGTIGSKFVQITLASVTADQFAGGYLCTTDDTGEGFTYRIRGNNATGDPASGDFRLELYDPLQVALDATTDIGIQGSLYANLEGATAATDVALAGVTVQTMDVSEQAYGWILVQGVHTALQDGTIAIGDMCTLSDSVTGAVQVAAGGGTAMADLIAEELVGHCLIAGDDTGHGVFKFDISQQNAKIISPLSKQRQTEPYYGYDQELPSYN